MGARFFAASGGSSDREWYSRDMRGVICGVELAFMSTTNDLKVAVRYCLSPHSLLFKIVASDFMSMGADVCWLSAFPDEEEMLYPPLTYLKPTGRSQVHFAHRLQLECCVRRTGSESVAPCICAA